MAMYVDGRNLAFRPEKAETASFAVPPKIIVRKQEKQRKIQVITKGLRERWAASWRLER